MFNHCKTCGADKRTTSSCIDRTVFVDGVEYSPVRWGHEKWFDSKSEQDCDSCVVCGVSVGGVHHPVCDFEACPKCGQQIFACGCRKDGVYRRTTLLERLLDFLGDEISEISYSPWNKTA
jgi:hypothetical protein